VRSIIPRDGYRRVKGTDLSNETDDLFLDGIRGRASQNVAARNIAEPLLTSDLQHILTSESITAPYRRALEKRPSDQSWLRFSRRVQQQ